MVTLFPLLNCGILSKAMNRPLIQVEIARPAAKDLKHLNKKYPRAIDDVEAFIQRLQNGETHGDQIPGTGYTVYKARIKSSDLTKGKSSGYRVIYYVRTTDHTILIAIYIKSERVDITPEEIRRMIDEYESKR